MHVFSAGFLCCRVGVGQNVVTTNCEENKGSAKPEFYHFVDIFGMCSDK